MSIENFFTAQTHMIPVKTTQMTDSIAAGKSGDVDKDAAQNFLDFMLAFGNGEAETNLKGQTQTGSQEQNTLKDTQSNEADKNLTNALTVEGEKLLALSEDQITDVNLETSLPAEEINLMASLGLNKTKLDNLLKSLEFQGGLVIESEEIPPEIAKVLNLNLTPAQLTALQDAQASDDEAAALDIFASIITFTPPKAKTSSASGEAATVANSAANENTAKGVIPSPSQEMAARLNALNPNSGADAGNAGGDAGQEFEQILKYLDNFKSGSIEGESKAQAKAGEFAQGLNNAGTPVTNHNAATHNGSQSALQGWPFSMDGSLFAPFESTLHHDPAMAALSPNSTQMGSLTSLIGQSQGAGHSHPATQMVAVNIQKAVAKGDSTNFTIELDPPELGRIEVKMSFGKDKSLSTKIVVEKPETYMMLQRDAGTLERTINDLGLESDGGVAFELAEQGFDFEQNNQRGGGHDKGGTGAGGESAEDLELIESSMTWHVDPESGHMRYDILA